MKHSILILMALWIATAIAARAQHPNMPPGMTHAEHLEQLAKEAELKKRGAAAMGFDQDKTKHHFYLTAEGGRIEVGGNDDASRASIRVHLKEIAADFSRGDFTKPFATHNDVPPGVLTMQQRKSAITFRYEDTAEGGRVTIITSDPVAKDAVHEFLRYQIREHATGDSLKISGERLEPSR